MHKGEEPAVSFSPTLAWLIRGPGHGITTHIVGAHPPVPETKVETIITAESGVMEIVMTGGDQVPPHGAIEKSLGPNLPARMIGHGAHGHQSEQQQEGPEVDGDEEDQNGDEGRGDEGLPWVEREGRPGGRLPGEVVGLVGGRKERGVVHGPMGPIKVRIV